MTTNKTYFDEYGELNVLGRMLYAEAMRLKRLDDLPNDIYDYVLESPWASTEIMDLYTLIETEEYSEEEIHPFFDISEFSLDEILEKLMSEATFNLTYEKAIEEQFAFRSSAAAAAPFKVKAPIANQLITESFIDFEWETNSNKDLIFTLENNQGRLVKERLKAGTTTLKVDLLPKDKFPSGLYYWKLALRGGKPIIGKVYIYSTLDKG